MKKKKEPIFIINIIDGVEYTYKKDDKTEEYHFYSRRVLPKKEKKDK